MAYEKSHVCSQRVPVVKAVSQLAHSITVAEQEQESGLKACYYTGGAAHLTPALQQQSQGQLPQSTISGMYLVENHHKASAELHYLFQETAWLS